MALTTDPCEYCKGRLDGSERLVTVHRQRRGRHFIFERVPARVCRRCGERYFSAATMERMEISMTRGGKHRTVKVPVIRLRAAG